MSARMVKLREILEVQSGFAFKTEFFNATDGVPLIRIRDLGAKTTETKYSGEFRDEFLVELGDYLIGMDGNFRCRRWEGPRALLNQRVCRLRNFGPQVLSEYVFYGIQPKLDAIEASTPFATVKHISARQILDIGLPLPPLEEQRRIVDLLSRAEGIVRLRCEAQKKAAAIIPALFLDMFGDPATNPKGWPVSTLGNLVKSIDSGRSPKCHDRPRNSDEWGVLRLGAVTRCQYDDSEHKTLPSDIEPDPSIEVGVGDLLVSRKNTLELVGAAAYVWSTAGRMLLPDLIFRLNIANHCCVHPIYLWQLLTTSTKRQSLQRLASGSAGSMPNISKERLRTLTIEVPDRELQTQFAELVERIHSINLQQSAALVRAQATFNSMLSRVFSGGERPAADHIETETEDA